MKTNYKIYILREKISGDIRYVGLTRNTLLQRLSGHLRDTSITHKTNWIKKVGKDNIEIILIEENINSKEEACEKEIFYISEYKKSGINLVNTTNGGDGWFDCNFSESHKRNISLNHADFSGEKNPMYGNHHKEESKIKIKEKFKIWLENVGYSDEQLDKMSKSRIGEKNHKSKLSKDDVLKIREMYNNGIKQKELSIIYNVDPPAIYKIVHKLNWKHI